MVSRVKIPGFCGIFLILSYFRELFTFLFYEDLRGPIVLNTQKIMSSRLYTLCKIFWPIHTKVMKFGESLNLGERILGYKGSINKGGLGCFNQHPRKSKTKPIHPYSHVWKGADKTPKTFVPTGC